MRNHTMSEIMGKQMSVKVLSAEVPDYQPKNNRLKDK